LTRAATSVASAVCWSPTPRALVIVVVPAPPDAALAMRSVYCTVVFFARSLPLFVGGLPRSWPDLGGILLLTGDGEECGEDVAHTYALQ
jgi:hypothetical protein